MDQAGRWSRGRSSQARSAGPFRQTFLQKITPQRRPSRKSVGYEFQGRLAETTKENGQLTAAEPAKPRNVDGCATKGERGLRRKAGGHHGGVLGGSGLSWP